MAPGLGGSSSWSASTFGLIFGLKTQDRARENENGKHSMMRGRSEASSREQSWIPEDLAKLKGEQEHPAQFGEVGKKQQSKISGQDDREYPRRGRQTAHTPKNRPSGVRGKLTFVCARVMKAGPSRFRSLFWLTLTLYTLGGRKFWEEEGSTSSTSSTMRSGEGGKRGGYAASRTGDRVMREGIGGK